MSTWGAYFSSYVKKTSDPKQVELEELKEKELLAKTSTAPKRIESGSSQKSVKKLYDLAAEENLQPKRSASNAARVAKMFGYGTPAPQEEVTVEAVAPMATWTKIEPIAPLSFKKQVQAPTPAPMTAPPPAKRIESKALPAAPPKPKSKQDIFAMLDDFASFADNPNAIQILPDLPAKKAPTVLQPPLKLETKDIVPRNTKENSRPAPQRKDSFWSITSSPASYRSSRKDSLQSSIDTPASSVSSISYRKDSFRGQVSPLLSRPKLSVAKNPVSLEPSEDFRARMMEFERQAEELKQEQRRRDEEREEILKYERMQDQMRYEREKMEQEREKMMEEQRRFDDEEARLAEEEKQMKSFMKNFQVEMERDRENEDRKRRAAEEAERERRKVIEAEERRIREEQEAEERRQRLEMEAEERRQRLEIEAEERRQREEEEAEERRLQAIRDKEEEERELREYEARRAQRQREAEEKERRLRLKDERLAQEEADRLTQLALREAREAQEKSRRQNDYEAELEADRRRFEEEEEEERREMERQRQYEAEQAERERFEQEEAVKERQRARDERIETQRRVARERAQRAQAEEDEARRRAQEEADKQFEAERGQLDGDFDDDRPLTKEEEMKKAEEKIRQAFAGLAQEKNQNAQGVQRSNTVAIQMPKPIPPVKNYARGITPAGRESRIYKEEQKQQSSVMRNNTVAAFGARPQPQRKVLQKPPRAPGGSMGNIGLPGGPRMGLPSGPGPRRNQTVRI